jgi:asparaginyl-tRNA synthetase
MRLRIKNVIKDTQNLGQVIQVKGWVRTLRDQKKFAFIELNDGSSLKSLQVVVEADLTNYDEIIEKATTGSAISVIGEIVESPAKGQKVELKAQKIEVIGTCPSDYPLQKKRHSFEFLRSMAHIRGRTNAISAVMRIRNALFMATHDFFQKRDFLYVNTPIISTSDCEGAGELFHVTHLFPKPKLTKNHEIDFSQDFFNKPAFLTVSGQLNAEAYAHAFSDVYTFGPTFRAENSHTSRHLAEFWMLEPEMAFANLDDDIELAQDYLKSVISYILENHLEDMSLFDQFISKGIIQDLEKIAKDPFERITYTEAIKYLEKSHQKFHFPVKWGLDLQSEHERYITEEVFKKPVVVTDYPKDIKAFYMRENEDGKTCAAMDVLVPKIGEIIGGSQREDRFDILDQKFDAHDLNKEAYSWYLDLRRYGGTPHAGFGLGFERLIQFVTGMENLRDVIPFPRTADHAHF